MSEICLIVCNGEAPSKTLLEHYLEKVSYSIAADGGMNTFLNYGLSPRLLVGDLDSFTKTDALSIEIEHSPDQESNDLEKALEAGIRRNFTEFIVLGATGKRVDQTLKNFSVMQAYHNKGYLVSFVDFYFESFILPEKYSGNTWPGQTISLFPISGKVGGIRTKGLKYPLNHEILENGMRDGSSNESNSSEIFISHESGNLLLMQQRNADEWD